MSTLLLAAWWRFHSIYFCCSCLWILRKCLLKIPILRLKISNWKLEVISLLACAGWRENKCKFFSQLFFELLIFTVHLTFSSEIETRHFRAIQPAKCQHANCCKNESESKKLRLQQWVTQLSVYRWHRDKSRCACADPTKTHSEGVTVQGPQIGGQRAGCGPGGCLLGATVSWRWTRLFVLTWWSHLCCVSIQGLHPSEEHLKASYVKVSSKCSPQMLLLRDFQDSLRARKRRKKERKWWHRVV